MEGVIVPLTKPAFFQSDRLPKWRTAGLAGWIWLRIRFRHNPGFVTAAAAGSIGLVLTLLLLLNGGFGYFGGAKPDESEVADQADLGEPSDPAPDKKSRTTVGLTGFGFDDDQSGKGGGAGAGDRAQPDRDRDDAPIVPRPKGGKPPASRSVSQSERPSLDDGPLLGDDSPKEETGSKEPPAIGREKSVAVRVAQPKVAVKEEEEEDEQPKAENDHGALTSDEPTTSRDEPRVLAEDARPARRQPSLGALPQLADDNATDKPSDNADDQDTKLADDEPRKSPPKVTTVVTAAPQTNDTAESAPAGDDDPFLHPQTRSSWKDSKAKPFPPVKEPETATGTRSRAIETAVYATPEPQAPKEAPKATKTPASTESGRLALEIRAPKYISPGQTFDLEFIVANTSRQPVEGALLSVALPPGIEHPQGPDLEQPIASLAGCHVYRGRMKVKATSAGEVSLRADVSIGERIGAQSTMPLRVGSPRAARSGRFDPCVCEPIRPWR